MTIWHGHFVECRTTATNIGGLVLALHVGIWRLPFTEMLRLSPCFINELHRRIKLPLDDYWFYRYFTQCYLLLFVAQSDTNRTDQIVGSSVFRIV